MARPITIGLLKKEGTPPWLYETLRQLVLSAKQNQTGLAAISRGEAPDGSGGPLTDTSGFFLLAGRPGGQIGRGDTGASGLLQFSSTSNTTKGKIHLGYPTARLTVDEAQKYVGVNQTSPSATVHIVGSDQGAGSSLTLTGDIDTTGTRWVPRGTNAWSGIAGTCAAAMSSDDGNTSMAAINFSASGVNPQRCTLSGAVTPGATYTIVLKYLVLGAPYDSGSIGVELVDSTGQRWVSWTGAAGGSEGSGITAVNSPPSFPAPTPTTGTTTVTRTVTCSGAGNSNGTGGTPNSINLYMRLQTGVSDLYGGVTYITISQAGSALVRWDLSSGTQSGQIDLSGHVGVGTGSTSLSAELTTISDTAGTVGVIIKGASSQTADLQQWQSSSATLSSVSAAGRIGAGTASTTLDAMLTGFSDATGTIGIKVKGFAGQTADLQQWQSSSATLSTVSAAGRIGAGTAATSLDAMLTGFSDATGTIGIKVKGFSGQTADLQQWNSSAAILSVMNSAGKLGILTSSPTNELSFGGTATRKIWMERHTTANTAGNSLTIQAGGATSGATNKAGGALILVAGTSTGNSTGSTIQLQTFSPGSSGTSDNTASTKLQIDGRGAISHTATGVSGAGLNAMTQTFAATPNNQTFVGNSWTHTLTGVVDSITEALFLQLSVTTGASDTGGTGIQGFAFEIYEDGVSGTGASASAVGGFIRHTSTAAGLSFTGYSGDVQTNTGAGSCDINIYIGTSSNLDAPVGTFIVFRALNPTINAGSITNLYGLYIDGMSGATNSWAIYAGGGQSAHAGKFSLGSTSAPAETLDLTGNIKISDATNGTKLGTATSQKLGFWNTAPIVQPTTSVAAATRVGGGGTTLTDTDTFDGYTVAKVVKALRNMGLLA